MSTQTAQIITKSPQQFNLSALPNDMDPGDRAMIQSFVSKYVNTGVKPTLIDQQRMLDLVKKYNLRINNNPRPIMSRFVKIRRNEKTADGKGIPVVRDTPKVKKIRKTPPAGGPRGY